MYVGSESGCSSEQSPEAILSAENEKNRARCQIFSHIKPVAVCICPINAMKALDAESKLSGSTWQYVLKNAALDFRTTIVVKRTKSNAGKVGSQADTCNHNERFNNTLHN